MGPNQRSSLRNVGTQLFDPELVVNRNPFILTDDSSPAWNFVCQAFRFITPADAAAPRPRSPWALGRFQHFISSSAISTIRQFLRQLDPCRPLSCITTVLQHSDSEKTKPAPVFPLSKVALHGQSGSPVINISETRPSTPGDRVPSPCRYDPTDPTQTAVLAISSLRSQYRPLDDVLGEADLSPFCRCTVPGYPRWAKWLKNPRSALGRSQHLLLDRKETDERLVFGIGFRSE
jgi:hypothetical protein